MRVRHNKLLLPLPIRSEQTELLNRNFPKVLSFVDVPDEANQIANIDVNVCKDVVG